MLRRNEEKERWEKYRTADYGPRHSQKTFTKKHPRLPTLPSYRGTFPRSYWSLWQKRLPPGRPTSWINVEKMKELAAKHGVDSPELHKAVDWCSNGAKLGCNDPDARLQTVGRNSPMAEKYGERVSDSLQQGIVDGTIIGPCTLQELEAAGVLAPKILPLSTRLKPNAVARLIIDGSHPHYRRDQKLKVGTPKSLNAGINKKEYPAAMATFREVNEALMRAGFGAIFAKVDWEAAYKHVGVARSDWRLQTVSWGGRLFTEEKLIFGCTSSPSIYIQTTMVPRQIAAKYSGMNLAMAPQYVNDLIPISHRDDHKVNDFINKYREVCREMGIKLATNEGGNTPDKCFEITNMGVLLGVEYNSARFFIDNLKLWSMINRDYGKKHGSARCRYCRCQRPK